MGQTLTHLDASASSADIAAALEADGAVIVDRLVAPEVLDTVTEEMAPFVDATGGSGDDFGGHLTRRTGGLIARSPASRDLVMHPSVIGTVNEVLSHAKRPQIHLTQIISIGPGETAQSIHRDQWAFDFFPFPNGFEAQCNTIWAMTDFTEENGATRVVPGSHRAEDKLRFEHDDSVPAEMDKGSVLFYTGSVYHGGGANNSDQVRQGLNLTYNVGWLRQEENQYLSVPPEIARTLDDDLLQWMGYAMGAYALGYVDDLRNPLDALRSADGATSLGGGEPAPVRG